ncbi:MAG TPA: alkaline phosphatase family protein [Arthrobacter sp.]
MPLLAACEPTAPGPAPPAGSATTSPASGREQDADEALPSPSSTDQPATGPVAQPKAPPKRTGTPGHIFVINLENKGFDSTWGNNSLAPYLSGQLRAQGVLLENYYGIAHNSLPNYLAQISGQPPNAITQRDCDTYSPFNRSGTDARGRMLGDGCVYPGDVPTVAGQISAAGKTWKGYMEDMASPCQHPSLGSSDSHMKASSRADQYATRHDPFVYFESVTSSPACSTNVVNLSALSHDLATVTTTPNLSYISPNLCHDGHDHPCVDGTKGGLATADQWLARQVPLILNSPAFKQDGMLVITFDESDGGTVGPPEGTTGSPTGGTAGGRIGALVISPFSSQGGTSLQPYNHYSLLASIEDFLGLPRLGIAAEPGVAAFGSDVYQHAT